MNRYITSNAAGRLPVEVQICLWVMIDRMEVERDYLQVFELNVWNGMQMVRHSQEIPEWKKVVILDVDSPVEEKVYVIEENGRQTMMLAEDY